MCVCMRVCTILQPPPPPPPSIEVCLAGFTPLPLPYWKASGWKIRTFVNFSSVHPMLATSWIWSFTSHGINRPMAVVVDVCGETQKRLQKTKKIHGLFNKIKTFGQYYRFGYFVTTIIKPAIAYGKWKWEYNHFIDAKCRFVCLLVFYFG